MKQVFVAAVVVLGALGFSSVAMASGRASSPAADGSAETHSLAKAPHAVTDSLNAGPTSARSIGSASRGSRAVTQRSTVGAASSGVRAPHMGSTNGTRTSTASSFTSSRSSRTR